ncbi:MAG: hypothetical protein PVF59_07875 [Desulfobacterales bacterium]|jgi:hypothetical protein
MYENTNQQSLPKTVDEAADLLISDLPTREMATLSALTENDFVHLYESVAQYVLEEFKVWTGNVELLDSCMGQVGEGQQIAEPAMVILRRVWQKLNDFPEILIVT